MFLFFAVVIGLGWYAWHSWSSKSDGLLSGLVSKAAEARDGGILVDKDKLPPKSNTSPPSVVPGRAGQPINTGDAFAPANPETATSELVSRTYRFKFREPPSPQEMLIQGTASASVTVDRLSRTVLVQGPIIAVDIIHGFLKEIDVPGGACSVQTWAVYVDRSVQKGFDLVAAISTVAGASDGTLTAGNGAVTLDLAADEITAALSVIADGSVVEVIQRPHVRLQHLTESRIESIQEFPVPETAVSQGIAQTSVNYRKVGLELVVTPYFMDSDRVRLAVLQKNGLIGLNVEIDGNQIPIIQSQTVQTSATLTVGQSVVLGGVSTRRERKAKGFLRDVSELTEGSLYVILSTHYDAPKAYPVSDAGESIERTAVPYLNGATDASEWIDGQLLPSRTWMDDEKDLIRSKLARPSRK